MPQNQTKTTHSCGARACQVWSSHKTEADKAKAALEAELKEQRNALLQEQREKKMRGAWAREGVGWGKGLFTSHTHAFLLFCIEFFLRVFASRGLGKGSLLLR